MKNSSYTDLTPVDDADSDGIYTDALSFALETPRIKNIALSGPYGSGKSSIIRTYEKNSDYKFLNISLASFKEDKKTSINSTLIERSILQQMLYGADANKLPYSRFKRISTPEKPLLKSLLLVAWAVVSISLYPYRSVLLDLETFSFLWFSGILFLSFSISVPVVLLSDFYKASFGLTLKKISLKNAEIEADELSENSILNRHLDEIIYFFQATDYDVVVIEDLDRFGDPEIFVKLREINKLINDNEKTRDQIKFLYAIKDDMFTHNNRTKFFDFIIPVVPIINSSNSLDKMQERLKKHDFAKTIDTQFLREVSFYLDDLRLIHNIFNEFVIYYERLKSESLDVEKLLAMMIYKNVYPDDFEKLHHGKGALHDICKKKSDYLRKLKKQLKGQLEEFRTSIKLANTEKARSMRELIDAYIGHIVMHASNNLVYGIVCDNQHIGLAQLTTFEQFEPVLSEVNIQIATQAQSHRNYRVITNKSFSQIEEEINPGETFLSRKKNIENRTNPKKMELRQKIKLIEKKIDELSQLQLFELLQRSEIKLDELIAEYKLKDGGLFEYLIRNGYLNDSYSHYISNFHEGRLTSNDRDYILNIRNFNQATPTQKIDTPKEVCANMREEDFQCKYVLNVDLIDYLFENKEISINRIKSVMHYISHNFEQSEEFFTAYFISGKHIDKFIRHLSREWPEFALSAISSKLGPEYLSYILKFVEEEYISEYMNTENQVTSYLSEQGALVLTSDLKLPDDYNVLKKLDVRFHDLVSLENNDKVLKLAHSECLYTITSNNINYILDRFGDSQSTDTIKTKKANYTLILDSGIENLKDYIEENIMLYLDKVFFSLPDNSEESESAIKKLINNDMIEEGIKEKIISSQDYVFETFKEIPMSLWTHILSEEKVGITWGNISEYLSDEDNDRSIVTNLLNRENVVDILSKEKISIAEIGKDESESLSLFILMNDEIKDSNYCSLIRSLPYSYSSFPAEVSHSKIECLANERKVTLSDKSFSFASDDNQLTATLIIENFNEYIKEKDEYPINDKVRELLLSSKIKNENKIIVCFDVTPSGTSESKQLSLLIADLIVSNEVDCSRIDDAVLSSAILNANSLSDSIRIITKCLSTWSEKQTMEVLSELPVPYSEISLYGNNPKIHNDEINLEFSNLLEKKGFISSVKVNGGKIKIYTFKSLEHS